MTDSHRDLPLDPDASADAAGAPARPLHLRPAMVGWVVLGGCAGTAARIGLEALVPRAGGLPLPTLAVNLLGAFLLGVLLEGLARGGPDVGGRRVARLVGGTGFCGAFTTYSALTVDAVQLAGAGRPLAAGGYLVVTLLVGLAASVAGIACAAAHHRSRRVA